MDNIIITNQENRCSKARIIADGPEKLHVVSILIRLDLFRQWSENASLISILRDENYLTPDIRKS